MFGINATNATNATTVLHIAIPRIEGWFTEDQVSRMFESQKIGRVRAITRHDRVDIATGSKYWFAFLEVEPFASEPSSREFVRLFNSGKPILVDYFRAGAWASTAGEAFLGARSPYVLVRANHYHYLGANPSAAAPAFKSELSPHAPVFVPGRGSLKLDVDALEMDRLCQEVDRLRENDPLMQGWAIDALNEIC